MLAKGEYRVRIVRQTLGVSSQKKTPNAGFECQVIGRWEDDKIVPVTVTDTRWVNLYFTPKTIDFQIETLQLLGFKSSSPDALNPDSPNYESLVGVEADVFVGHKPYNGEMQEQIRFIDRSKPRGGGNSDEAANALADMFGSKLAEKQALHQPVDVSGDLNDAF